MAQKKFALALEGGSLRCLFTAGVLDVFMENHITFDALFGTSAGSLSAVNFVSNQPRRTMRVNVDFVRDHRYLGPYAMLKSKSIFDFGFLFSQIGDIYLPLDWETFFHSETQFTCCTTNCETGQPEFFSKTHPEIQRAIVAGSSMPLLSPIVPIGGVPHLDGGITNAIPYQRALDEGYEKVLVVPTREHGFRKPLPSKALAALYLRRYYRYPALIKALLHTPAMYARQMKEIDQLQAAGRIHVLRPAAPITISRMERDPSKLIALYQQGRALAAKQLPAVLAYLGQ